MAPNVSLRVDFDDDWNGGDIFLPDGVLLGYVTLRIRGNIIIDYGPYGMNASAVSLLRTLERSHVRPPAATTDDERYPHMAWPLFFCAGSLWNRCGIVADSSVRRDGQDAVFGDWLRCDVPAGSVLRVPWVNWATAVERLGQSVLRRCPIEKKGVSARYRPRYTYLRNVLTRLLHASRRRRASNPTLDEPVRPVTGRARQKA